MKSFKHLLCAALVSLLASTAALAADVVDINRADAAELSRVLVGVGPAKAEAIVEYREREGDFRSAEELAKVSGIGLSTVENNAERIEVGGARRASRDRDD